MNIAQAIVRIDNGDYEWRQDTHPGICVMLLELRRMPRLRMLSTSERATACYRKRHALSLEERAAIAEQQLEVLRNAGEKRLSFSEICKLVGCEFNQSTRHILQRHIDARVVETCGRGRAARYWARRAR